MGEYLGDVSLTVRNYRLSTAGYQAPSILHSTDGAEMNDEDEGNEIRDEEFGAKSP